MAIEDYFVWGDGGARMTPEEIAQQRLLLAKNSKIDTSPVASWTQGAARVADAVAGAFQRGAIDRAAKANDADNAGIRSDLTQALFGSPTAAAGQAASIGSLGAASQMSATSPDPISDVLTAGGNPPQATNWLQYGNEGATRSQPLNPKLVSALGFLPEMGVQMHVFSGGQPDAAEGGPRTGSVRHDHGNAGDVFFSKDGRKLDWNNPDDVPIFQQIVERGKANGVTGFGAGPGYMQPGSMHIGFGTNAVWGAGGKSANAPDWLRSAYSTPYEGGAQQQATGPAGAAPTQVASLGPSAGMNAPMNASQAIQSQAPTTGYVDPAATTAYAPAASQVASLDRSAGMGSIPPPAVAAATAQPPQGMAIPVPTPRPDQVAQAQIDPATASPDQMMSALGIQPDQAGQPGQPEQPASSPETLAAAVANRTPAAPVSPAVATVADALKTAPPSAAPAGIGLAQSPKQNAAIIKALTSPYVDEGTRRLATIVYQKQQAQQQQQQQYVLDQKKAAYEQQLKQADPMYQQTLRKAQYENDHLGQVSPDTQATLAAADKRAKTDADNAWIQAEHEQELKSSAPITPTDQARLDFDRQKFEAETKKGQWQKLTDGRLYNETTGEFRDAPPPVKGSTPMKPDDVSGMRKEIQQLPSYKNLSQAAPIYKSMLETSGRDSKASDLNLVYGLGKIMDPTSVVREGEMVMVKNTASLPDWLVGAANSLNGGAALQPDTRKAIMREAYGRVTGYNNEFKQDMGQYQGIAKRYNINPEDIIPATEDFQNPEVEAPKTTTTGIPWKVIK